MWIKTKNVNKVQHMRRCDCNLPLRKGELAQIILSYEEEARRVRIMNSLFKARSYSVVY
jgi:hypothetical protein